MKVDIGKWLDDLEGRELELRVELAALHVRGEEELRRGPEGRDLPKARLSYISGRPFGTLA